MACSKSNIRYGEAPCPDCPDTCLGMTTYSSCIEYTGPSIPELGVESGMSFDQVVDKLFNVEQPATNKTLTGKDVVVRAGTTGVSYNPCTPYLLDSFHSLALIGSNADPILRYDLSRVYPTSGYSTAVVSVRGITEGLSNINGFVFSSSSISDDITLSANDFPLTITATIQVNTPCGPARLTGSSTIESPVVGSPTTLTLSLESASGTDTSEISLEDKIIQMDAKLNDLVAKYNSLL